LHGLKVCLALANQRL
jgi:hypothetical protein